MTTSQSTVVGNVTAIGPTEFAFALQVFFTVPASMTAGGVLVRTVICLYRGASILCLWKLRYDQRFVELCALVK